MKKRKITRACFAMTKNGRKRIVDVIYEFEGEPLGKLVTWIFPGEKEARAFIAKTDKKYNRKASEETAAERIRKDKEEVLAQMKEIHAALGKVNQALETQVLDPLGDLASEANGLLYDVPEARFGKADIGKALDAFYEQLASAGLPTALESLADLYFQISRKQITD